MHMYNIAIIYMGESYEQHLNTIKLQELLGKITVIGIGCQDVRTKYIDGYPIYSVEEVLGMQYDYLLIGGQKENFAQIKQLLVKIGVDKSKVFSLEIFSLPLFDFERYVQVAEKNISIISNHCWGGYTYHSLRAEFLSPFINMFITQDDYINLLEHFDEYMEEDVVYLKDAYETNLRRNYPIGILEGSGIKLWFNHYETFEDAKQKWQQRKKRINKDALFIEMQTDDEKILERFDALPFKHKIAFVPFETTSKSGRSLKCFSELEKRGFAGLANDLAAGFKGYYDLLKLLNGEEDFCRLN